jgi:hypothetical protein
MSEYSFKAFPKDELNTSGTPSDSCDRDENALADLTAAKVPFPSTLTRIPNFPPAPRVTHDVVQKLLGDDKALFTITETAALCRRSRVWVYRLMRRGAVRFIPFGGAKRIPRSEIERILSEGVT